MEAFTATTLSEINFLSTETIELVAPSIFGLPTNMLNVSIKQKMINVFINFI
jgi:hypothetical protein